MPTTASADTPPRGQQDDAPPPSARTACPRAQVPAHHRVLLDARLEVARRVQRHAGVAPGPPRRRCPSPSSTKLRAKSRSPAVPRGLPRGTPRPSADASVSRSARAGRVLLAISSKSGGGGASVAAPRRAGSRAASRSGPGPRGPRAARAASPRAAAAGRGAGRRPRRSGAPRSGPRAAPPAGAAARRRRPQRLRRGALRAQHEVPVPARLLRHARQILHLARTLGQQLHEGAAELQPSGEQRAAEPQHREQRAAPSARAAPRRWRNALEPSLTTDSAPDTSLGPMPQTYAPVRLQGQTLPGARSLPAGVRQARPDTVAIPTGTSLAP